MSCFSERKLAGRVHPGGEISVGGLGGTMKTAESKTIAIHRRQLLRSLGALAGGLIVAPWLSGCGDGPAPAAGSGPPLQVDPGRPWWLQNNFEPISTESEHFDLPVVGELPRELRGLYVRNGSNAQSGISSHWFLGDGMLHGIRLEDGRATWYRNRFIRTSMYANGIDYSESGPPLGGTNQSNVSVVRHGGRLLTSGEVGAPYEIDPHDLRTIGVHDFDGKLNTSFTAHPKIDPATGDLHFFGYFFTRPYLTYHVANAAGEIMHSSEIPLPASSMIHSFAITERDVVFWDLPVHFAPEAMAARGFPYAWQESAPARIGVLPLGGTGDQVRWVEIEPCFVFHEVNAFRAGDEIVLDVCRLDRFLDGRPLHQSQQDVRRWRIDTAGSSLGFREETIHARALDFPMHDKRFTGRQNRHGWFTTFREHPQTLDPAGILHMDLERGQTISEWNPGRHRQVGEAFFVPAGPGEGEGWLLTYLYDRARKASRFVVLDAGRVGDGPLAEVELPQRVPHGFHGTWIPDAT